MGRMNSNFMDLSNIQSNQQPPIKKNKVDLSTLAIQHVLFYSNCKYNNINDFSSSKIRSQSIISKTKKNL